MSGNFLMRPILVALVTAFAAAGCSERPPARSVADFMDDSIGLEATLARCNSERGKLRDDPECINARDANNRLAAAEKKERQRQLELESQRKRDAIRRRSEAAAQAQREAEEAAQRREELLYEQQFQAVPSEDGSELDGEAPSSVDTGEADTGSAAGEPPAVIESPAPAPSEQPDASSPTDLNSLREELNRRNQTEESDQPPA